MLGVGVKARLAVCMCAMVPGFRLYFSSTRLLRVTILLRSWLHCWMCCCHSYLATSVPRGGAGASASCCSCVSSSLLYCIAAILSSCCVNSAGRAIFLSWASCRRCRACRLLASYCACASCWRAGGNRACVLASCYGCASTLPICCSATWSAC